MAEETFRVTPTESDAQVTRRVSGGDASTRRVSAETAMEDGLPLGVLEPGSYLCTDCRVERTLQPHESQRPGLYLCHAPEGRVIVKVAPTQHPPKPELWQRLAFLRHPHVLRTFRALEQDGFFFEVQEFCTGGTLEDRVPKPGSGFPPVSANWVMTVMMPQILPALQYLHAQEIIHRDIKPANIYLREENGMESLVLGDFDISSVLEQTRTSRDTQRAAGTWLYTAPEAFPRFVDDHASSRRGRVSRSCDYYSLGVTIIELLLGTTSLHLCQLPDLFDFYLQGGRVEIPQGIPGRLALLLRGLLIRDRRTRWGGDEVERWLAGENSDADLQRIHDDEYYELARASRPYRMGERLAVDLPSLADVMFQEQAIATEDLITADILLNWVGNLDPNMARAIRRDRDTLYMTPDLVLYSAIMRCDPTRPFIFPDGAEAQTADEWITHAFRQVRNGVITVEELCTPAQWHYLEAWLRLKNEPEPALADAVAAIPETPAPLRFEELAYLLKPDLPFTLMPGVSAETPKEFVRLTYGKPEEWQGKRPLLYEMSYQRWYDGALCAWMRRRGLTELAEQCDELRAQLDEEPGAAFEKILRLLDPALPPVEVVFDVPGRARVRTLIHGEQATSTLRYFVRGCGVPYGALQLDADGPGAQLDNHLIRQRNGEITVTLDAGQGQQAFKLYTVALTMESGIATMVNTPVKLQYQVAFAPRIAVMRVLAGAGIGALVFGIPRLALSLLGEARPLSLRDGEFRGLWNAVNDGDLPHTMFLIAATVFAVCLYVGLRIWFAAYRRSEV